MSGSVNKVVLVGNLGRDPEVRQTNNGQRLANLAVATSERWTDKQSGEKRERTEWHRVVVFDDRIVDVCERFLSKGSKVYLEGQLQTRKWQDQSGQDRYTTEVVLQRFRSELQMLDRPNQGQNQQQSGGQPQQAQRQPEPAGAPAGGGGGGHDLDDEIPF